MRKSLTGFVGRVRLLSALFILVAVLLTARLYFVQIVKSEEHLRSAEGQYIGFPTEAEDRWDIFFSKKEGDLVAAALMQAGWRIAIVPKDIAEPEQVFAKLSEFASLDRDRFFASTAKVDDPYEEVGYRVSDATAKRIRAQKLPGVVLVQDQWRTYPGSPLAAHTVGFVGYQGDRKVGVYGLERSFEKTLAKSSSSYVNPFAEIFTNIEAALSPVPADNHGSLITSIEPQVEARLEEVLNSVVKTYTPKVAAGIVMNPRTGEIIAMAARPGFDPNTYGTVSDISVFRNPLVESVYEMGSIMKPLTIAAGLDVGAITPDSTYDDKGCIKKSGKEFCNYDNKARGVVPIQEILNQSLNLGASYVVDRIGHNIFREYVHAYGLGEKTGIDLPNEGKGMIRTIDRGYDIDYASASFGQSIAVTALEMIRGLSALANDGVLPSPHVVRGIRLESGIVREITPAQGPRALKSETVQTVSDMLVKVFDTALLGGVLKQEHYSIAAKTGTAQIALPQGGGYYKDRFLHSFFGYFPAHDPQFIVFLIAVEPHGAQFASATLARPFLDIAKFLINYYNVPPDR
ncbi:hypothetical protein A3A39_04060 [Candidatus Kaiserbacteria bacterium RIFCSPLOWO2_01_FULL_54_13]|uniref:Uncharacterized protein n=1 Tax=Candidatus Kaiserbacteria bacterium RIFCSPLOWO2_01_FULL_54_13 TaxID=1798512 RepID=A0A1F6F457_9BACT|nr:MAG: hypothetical protein A3A39_04060 [Candidatus Kaiserbacteria bacterium RIFCSPLOWO2_01_FULL_54_13]